MPILTYLLDCHYDGLMSVYKHRQITLNLTFPSTRLSPELKKESTILLVTIFPLRVGKIPSFYLSFWFMLESFKIYFQ